jgi:hypothetical protein
MESIVVSIVKTAAPVIISMFKKATITGYVLDSSGKPVSDVFVVIGKKEDSSAFDGSFVISGIPGGDYSVSLKYIDEIFDNVKRINIENGEKIEITITLPERIKKDKVKIEEILKLELNSSENIEKQSTFKGKVFGVDGVKKLMIQYKNEDIYIGFTGGRGKLRKAKLEELEVRTFKWDDNINPPKQKANWIPIKECLDIINK